MVVDNFIKLRRRPACSYIGLDILKQISWMALIDGNSVNANRLVICHAATKAP